MVQGSSGDVKDRVMVLQCRGLISLGRVSAIRLRLWGVCGPLLMGTSSRASPISGPLQKSVSFSLSKVNFMTSGFTIFTLFIASLSFCVSICI